MSDEEKNRLPNHLPGTQWKVDDVSPQRLKQGRHLLHMNTTDNGISGSPLYKLHAGMEKALVIGVHVGGSPVLGNAAVPVSYHLEPAENSFSSTDTSKSSGKNLDIIHRVNYTNLISTQFSILRTTCI